MILLDHFSANLVQSSWDLDFQWAAEGVNLYFTSKDHPTQKLADYNEQGVLTWLFPPSYFSYFSYSFPRQPPQIPALLDRRRLTSTFVVQLWPLTLTNVVVVVVVLDAVFYSCCWISFCQLPQRLSAILFRLSWLHEIKVILIPKNLRQTLEAAPHGYLALATSFANSKPNNPPGDITVIDNVNKW